MLQAAHAADRAADRAVIFYEYTVFFGDDKFTAVNPSTNDMRFLQYFYQRGVAPDEAGPEPQPPRPPGLISRIFSWMTQPV